MLFALNLVFLQQFIPSVNLRIPASHLDFHKPLSGGSAVENQ